MSNLPNKIDFKTIMIIGLVIVILLLQMCKGDKKDIKKARIEIIPMIDIMFFLLATIMLSSLQIQHQHLLKLNNIEWMDICGDDVDSKCSF